MSSRCFPYLFGHHVDSILDTTIRDYGEHRRIDDSKAFDTMDLELLINNTLFNVLGQAKSATRI
jgi:hypothetical protein